MPTKKVLLEAAQKARDALASNDVQKTSEIIRGGLFPPKKPKQAVRVHEG